ncbi:MAG: hypothetical protein MPW17_23230 (plasmid) [Candidatus Manganitrophus sp.]|nr:MAG: hypothetical protein MPW17_23230 [Candidatus Manganitrophus sp.]
MTLEEMAQGRFAPLNVVILKREKPADASGPDRPVRWEGPSASATISLSTENRKRG